MTQTNALEPCRPRGDLAGLRGLMGSGQILQDLADIFKLLGDHTRVRILQALALSELCVCSLAELLNMSPSAVSHQLRILRAAKVVKFRKNGKHIYYSLDDPHVANLMHEGLEHVQEGKG